MSLGWGWLPLLLCCGFQITWSDEYPKFLIRAPAHDSFAMLPVHFRCEILAIDTNEFLQENGKNEVCIEVDDSYKQCHDMSSTDMILHDLSHGPHSARVFMQDSVTRQPLFQPSEKISFTVVTKERYHQHLVDQYQQLRATGRDANVSENGVIFHPSEQSLLDWAQDQSQSQTQQQQGQEQQTRSEQQVGPYMLVIGVKTSLEDGFPYRQAIRATWAKSLPQNVRVWFVGCQFDASSATSPPSQELVEAIDLERNAFGDLLTTEVDCVDSYYQLVQKTTAFFSFVVQHSEFQYAMITDDDIYLRVDILVDLLLANSPRHEFYAGQVWSTQLGRVVRPQRDISSKNYLSKAEYPMSELPPFAIGPHYIVSVDCAEFIAENRHRLAGVGTLEDVSVSIWLLALQVHPQHITNFKNLNDFECENDLISLADLSSLAIRSIHENVISGRSFCDGVSVLWSKPTYALMIPQSIHEEPRRYQWQSLVQLLPDGNLEMEVQIQLASDVPAALKSLTYLPTQESTLEFLGRICSTVGLTRNTEDCIAFQRGLLDDMMAINVELADSSVLALFRHNVQIAKRRLDTFDSEASNAQPPEALWIVYSPMAQYVKVVLENLFVLAFGGQLQELLVVPEHVIQQDQMPVEVFVFSVLDGGCGSSYAVECQLQAVEFLRKYQQRVEWFVLLSGEAWELDALQSLQSQSERDILLFTTERVSTTTATFQQLYLPVVSTSFGERMNTSPVQLLRPSSKLDSSTSKSTLPRSRFCAYMYARCDRPQREYMFDLLNNMEPVDALGACQGASVPAKPSKRLGRIQKWYNDEAVQLFREYKFVIAFENAQTPGYITEKIVNAFLAGSIPVYFGHSQSVQALFNPKSFIDCSNFASLRQCAERVVHVFKTPQLYNLMQQEPPIVNLTAFEEAFGWHPDVASSVVRQRLQEIFAERIQTVNTTE